MSDIARRNAANRRKGQRWQADLRQGLRQLGLDVEELKLAGIEDEGDLVLRRYDEGQVSYLILEAKNDASFNPAGWIGELQSEVKNFANHRMLSPERVEGIVVIKRRMKNWKQAYVLTTLEDYLRLP